MKYKIHLKAAKDPIHGYLINPDLEPPQVIVDFPNNYKAWLEARKDEMEQPQTVASEEEVTQLLELDSHHVESGTEVEHSQNGLHPVLQTNGEETEETTTQIIEMEGGAQFTIQVGGKRKSPEASVDEPTQKISRQEDDPFAAAIQQHSDLITVHDADLTTTVVDVVTDSSIPANVEVLAEDEDDLAAELPDGFYSTSCMFCISIHVCIFAFFMC